MILSLRTWKASRDVVAYIFLALFSTLIIPLQHQTHLHQLSVTYIMSQSTTNHEYTFRDKATGEMRSITSIPGIPDIMVRIIQLPENAEGNRLRVQTGIAQKDDRILWKNLDTRASFDLSEAEELFKTEKPTEAVTISRVGLLFNFEEGFSECGATGWWKRWGTRRIHWTSRRL